MPSKEKLHVVPGSPLGETADASASVFAKVPDLSGESDWTETEPLAALGQIRSFVSGDPNGSRIRIRYYLSPSDRKLHARVWFGRDAEGPPGHAHGGALIAVLDELMGSSCWVGGHKVVLARLTSHMKAMAPLETVMHAEGEIAEVRGRKVFAHGRITLADGQLLVEAEGLFVQLKPDSLASLVVDNKAPE